MNLHALIQKALDLNASDVFMVAGTRLNAKVQQSLIPLDETILKPEDTHAWIEAIYQEAKRPMDRVLKNGDDVTFTLLIDAIEHHRHGR